MIKREEIFLNSIEDLRNLEPVDLDKIPKYQKDRLAEATYYAVLRFLAQPGGREALDEEIERLGLRKNKNIAG